MIIRINFDSNEAYYIQLYNQIIYGIANDKIKEGDNLPSVRQMAENIGINMHTVNKAYALLKDEGYLKVDRRKGSIISIQADKYAALEELFDDMRIILAKAACKGVEAKEVHQLIDRIYDEFRGFEDDN